MPLIQTPEPGLRLSRQYGLEGPPMTPTVAPEIVPVTIVDDLSLGSQPSVQDPGYPRPAFGSVSITAVTNQPTIALVAPAGSGYLYNIERVLISTPTTGAITLRITTVAGFNESDEKQFRDARIEGIPALFIGSLDQTNSGDIVGRFTMTGNRTEHITVGQILDGSTLTRNSLVIHHTSSGAVTLRAWAFWQEIPILKS